MKVIFKTGCYGDFHIKDNQDLQDAQDFYPVNLGYPGHPDSNSINKAHKFIGVVFENFHYSLWP
ncbi:hypothetical protein MTBBW1_290006 [Desulfamplus magnetovallimortis]|uniref:Uncharacterized protein n=1 Tax=Desulfamplus magnetovallimortis TaxID=1246637 RepID=A0A1W1HFR2_9BACT|nr:hypothetical protein MTBBW1_290006 [Desulfamplus magnetovallimortis]